MEAGSSEKVARPGSRRLARPSADLARWLLGRVEAMTDGGSGWCDAFVSSGLVDAASPNRSRGAVPCSAPWAAGSAASRARVAGSATSRARAAGSMALSPVLPTTLCAHLHGSRRHTPSSLPLSPSVASARRQQQTSTRRPRLPSSYTHPQVSGFEIPLQR